MGSLKMLMDYGFKSVTLHLSPRNLRIPA